MTKKEIKELGYIHKDELTDDFLFGELAKMVGVIDLSKEEENNFFEQLSRVEDVRRFLQGTASKDVQRYFGATDDKQRDLVRGAFTRTVYMLSKLKASEDVKVEPRTKIKGLRYTK